MSRVEDLKSQNPMLDVSVIDLLSEGDPSNTHKYLGFIIKNIKDNFEDRGIKTTDEIRKWLCDLIFDSEYLNYLKRFEEHTLNKRIENPDISSYKNFDEIIASVDKADKKLKEANAEKQIIKIYESDSYLILIPLSFEASKTYGANTKWCTTTKQHWDTYQWKYKLLYIINKTNNDKYAISVKYDDKTKIQGWLADDSEISPFKLPIDKEIIFYLTDEIQSPMYSTEMKYLNENSIITTSGNIIPLDKCEKNDIIKFLTQFGEYITPNFKSKLNSKLNNLEGFYKNFD